ncbi:MAG: protein phosphatase 2C domain-containing protein [Halioglobus sp.]|nr:protein phosphatase 2C domain-containing protein [Halioglobus sp.]
MNDAIPQFAADTHSGLHRSLNEDSFGAYPDLGLWLVADGVGGHSCGEIASNIVRSTLREQVAGGASLESAVTASHDAVLRAIESGQGAAGMGSTVIALRLSGNDYELCWVGDSRAYLWDGALRQVSHDHNRVAELLASNAITREQAANHPQRHVLTQSLGVSPSMELAPGRATGTLQPGDALLLCSDGLTDELSDSLIAHLLQDHATPRAQVDALMSAALDAGGRDNITAIIVSAVAPPADKADIATDEFLETTQDNRRSASGGKPNDGRFPLRALILLSALAVLAVMILL